MLVRVADDGKVKSVDVLDERCPGRWCFWISTRRGIHRYDGPPVCGHREQTGCPDDKDAAPTGWTAGYRKARSVWHPRPKP